MPRPTKSQTKPVSGKKRFGNKGKLPSGRRTSGRLYYQCMHCGAMANPVFGTGEWSWCPSCKKIGEVCCAEGELPDVPLYGHWLESQEKSRNTPSTGFPQAPAPLSIHSLQGGISMKTPKHHTGLYCCPECCIEYDLVSEERLQCDECKGPLLKGSLDEYDADEYEEG